MVGSINDLRRALAGVAQRVQREPPRSLSDPAFRKERLTAERASAYPAAIWNLILSCSAIASAVALALP